MKLDSHDKRNFFVTATGTNIGKTYTTLRLMELFAKKGYKVGAFKPIETGVKNYPEDGLKLLEKSKELNKEFKNITLDDVVPVRYALPAAPIVAKGDQKIDFKLIKSSFEKLKKSCDILFIEGAGGLMVPIEDDFYMIDLINYFNAKAVLVTGDKLGCINETLLSISKLNQKSLSFKWCVNIKDQNSDFYDTTLPYYKRAFKKVYLLPSDLETFGTNLLQ